MNIEQGTLEENPNIEYRNPKGLSTHPGVATFIEIETQT
jgi:hypothetical protein